MDEDDERRIKSKLNKAKKAKKKRAQAKKAAASSSNDDEVSKRVNTEEKPVKPSNDEETEENLHFEDPFEDVYDEDEEIVDAGEEEEGEDVKMAVEGEDDDDEENGPVMYYPPSKQQDGEELEVDPSAYGTLQQMKFAWPALSFDFFVDHMGYERTRFPMSVWLVTGSQTESPANNELNVMRVANIHRTKHEDEEEGMVLFDDAEEEGDATLEHRTLEHNYGPINRIRAMPQQAGVVACWGEAGKVSIYDTRRALQTLDLENVGAGVPPVQRTTPVYVMDKHKQEGYGLDWSPCRAGRLASGDQARDIYIWEIGAGGTVSVDPQPFKGHKGSVEDLQWSPTEETVLASCSTDGTVKIWDVRVRNGNSMLTQNAHEQDVNVISWNRKVSYLLASGSDDCSFKVWDLRHFSGTANAEPVGWFKGFHTDSITSIEWSPHDESVIACASADHQTTVWDLALEEDREFARQAVDKGFSEDVLGEDGRPIQFPPQLLFVHAGVRDPKELHFHPQAVGLIGVTGDSGFDLFMCEPLDPKAQVAQVG